MSWQAIIPISDKNNSISRLLITLGVSLSSIVVWALILGNLQNIDGYILNFLNFAGVK